MNFFQDFEFPNKTPVCSFRGGPNILVPGGSNPSGGSNFKISIKVGYLTYILGIFSPLRGGINPPDPPRDFLKDFFLKDKKNSEVRIYLQIFIILIVYSHWIPSMSLTRTRTEFCLGFCYSGANPNCVLRFTSRFRLHCFIK